MYHYRNAHRWVCGHELDHRLRCRFFTGIVDGRGVGIYIGWQNVEVIGMKNADRFVWYYQETDAWLEDLHISRYLCAPTEFSLHSKTVTILSTKWKNPQMKFSENHR